MPEYPQNPVAHRKRPTTIRINGSTIHWDVDFFVGHKKDTRGKAGLWEFVFESVTMVFCVESDRDCADTFFFFLGLCIEEAEESIDRAIMDVDASKR
ncbi:hypothetical protein MMC06_006527 [Schaereria dolodes]|nr:hypothetical protein [Schaereria dolodes]